MNTGKCLVAVSSLFLGFLFPVPESQAQIEDTARILSHDIFKELIEINSTDSVGSVTAAAEAMAKRFRDAGFAEADHKWLVAYVTRSGNPGLWPITLSTTGRPESYSDSARAIVREYAGQWIRVICDQADKQYTAIDTTLELPPPRWPDGGFQWMLETAFKNRFVTSLNHPYLQFLRTGVMYDAG